ncbi:MAG: Tad domain-containing protein, partial [Armatimonadetes bacterium]|nr:Tad domain-containing protein [Armatimonadota bacterium]
MVWVVVALVALLGMAALTVDIGQLVIAAQVAQNTVDAAALAGVSQLPDLTEATTETGFYIEANNEEHGFHVALISENAIVCRAPGETVEGYGQLPDDEHALTVTGQVEVSYVFAPLLGLESATITRSATALQMPGDMPTTIFAHHENEHAIIFSGDDLDITGLVHSNGGIDVNGMNTMFHDPVEYFNILRDPSGTTTYEAG